MDLLSEFSIKIYEPPLSHVRSSGHIANVSDVVCTAMLVVDFETEVSMNGIANFIGNSTGRYASETVLALERIGCADEAAALGRILSVASEAGMTHATVQADRDVQRPFAVASFSQLHGSKWNAALERIGEVFGTIDMARTLGRLDVFMDAHRAIFEKALGR
jgi:hypothetical protein